MRKRIAFIMIMAFVWLTTGCGALNSAESEKVYAGAPTIVLNGYKYFASDMVILQELPAGYSYDGELTDAEKEYAHIIGSKYYIQEDEGTETLNDFYVYQECGTRISDDEVDNTKRQWAYARWSKEENSTDVLSSLDGETVIVIDY